MKPNDKIVLTALQEASQSRAKFRVAAVVYRRGEVLGVGVNDPKKTHPKSTHPYRTIHAELDAVLSAVRTEYWTAGGWRGALNGVSIYVHRILKDGSPGLAKPCVYCEKLLSDVGIKEVYFSE